MKFWSSSLYNGKLVALAKVLGKTHISKEKTDQFLLKMSLFHLNLSSTRYFVRNLFANICKVIIKSVYFLKNYFIQFTRIEGIILLDGTYEWGHLKKSDWSL